MRLSGSGLRDVRLFGPACRPFMSMRRASAPPATHIDRDVPGAQYSNQLGDSRDECGQADRDGRDEIRRQERTSTTEPRPSAPGQVSGSPDAGSLVCHLRCAARKTESDYDYNSLISRLTQVSTVPHGVGFG
jgi:hypothetical protein